MNIYTHALKRTDKEAADKMEGVLFKASEKN